MFLTNELERIQKNIDHQLSYELLGLSPSERELLLQAVKKKEKSIFLTYFLCCLGGSHYLYLGDIKTQVIFWFTLGGLGIWWIIELIYLKQRVNIINSTTRLEFARKFAPKFTAAAIDSSTQTMVLENFSPPNHPRR